MTGEAHIRPARKTDASDMVILIDGAGYGAPQWIWAGMRKDEASVLDIGRRRAMREEGGFSYRNTQIIEADGVVAGMLTGYLVADPYEAGEVSAVPEAMRAIVELESMVPGAWYINVLTLHEEFRGRGLGKRLLAAAENVARDSGANALACIIESRNAGASTLYLRNGFAEYGRRPRIAHPGAYTKSEDWVLLRKQL
jgi:ribosomal protein S18 acetylase RimI-like enzyme